MEGSERNTNGRCNEFMILIGTPAYNGMVHIDYFKSVLGFAGVFPFEVMNIGNESLISRARNNIIAYFYYNPKYTHLLFIDGDIEIKCNDVIKMIQHNKDVIGAAIPMKGVTEDGRPVLNINEPELVEGYLFKVSHVGTAVFMMSRRAVEALVEVSPKYSDGGVYKWDVFQTGVVDGLYLSEDFYACHKLRQLGFDIFVDESIIANHWGMIKL